MLYPVFSIFKARTLSIFYSSISALIIVSIMLLFPAYTHAQKPAVKALSTISAFVGDARFTLFGFTSPYATVMLKGQGIYDKVQANKNGYFIFKNRFSPLSPREACLFARDTEGRVSQPVCLPPFPIHTDVTIGPIYLSPTITVNKNEFVTNDFASTQGQTIPNTDVQITFASDLNDPNRSFPSLKTHTDNDGNFSMTLPTHNPQSLRVFATTKVDDNLSGKSNTLTIDILPLWRMLLNQLRILFTPIKDNLFALIFISEVTALILLWLIHHRRKKYPLALRPEHSLKHSYSKHRF